MSEVWFTSDTHFGHANVIKYSHRPFETVEEMDEKLIENYNAVIRPGDRVYHLGDFSFHKDYEHTCRIAKRLVGQKYLIFGNHDKRIREKSNSFLGHWTWAKDLAEIKIDDQKIVMCHYALLTWNQSHYGSWALHGHSHGSLPVDLNTRRLDVGVDPCNYRPISYGEIRDIMSNRIFKPIDHHVD